MSSTTELGIKPSTGLNLARAVLLSLLMLFVTYFTMGIYGIQWSRALFRMDEASIRALSMLAAYALANTLFFLTIFMSRTDRYRAVFFLLVAISFPIGFTTGLFELRGHFMTATFENIIQGKVPFCHIVIPQTLIPLLLKQIVVFPGTLISSASFQYSIGFMIMLWIAASIGIGRGFCSWTCFYGGWEDGFSRLLKKPVIKNISPTLRFVPYAMLATVALSSLVFVVPSYCLYLCPFKSVSEFIQVLSPVNIIQTVLFILLFLALVIVFPLLTRKRTQCSYFCPFGAMQSLVDKVNVFDLRINTAECSMCKKCIRECPMSSITDESLLKGKVGNTCVKCGKCVDLCPKKAISYHIKGTRIGGTTGTISRIAFLILSYIIIASMGGVMIATGLYRVLLLATTGSILQ
jgi:ferredoxin-type protein NapH